MTKKTKAAFAQAETLNRQADALNQLKNIEIAKMENNSKIAEADIEARDRVNISKNEYLNLLEENKRLKRDNESKRAFIKKIIDPLLQEGLTIEQIAKIFDEPYAVATKVGPDPCGDPYYDRVAVLFKFEKRPY